MADVRINFEFDGLNEADKFLKGLVKASKDLQKNMKKTGTTLESDAASAKKLAAAAKKVATEKKKLTAIEKEELRQKRALETVTAKLALASSKENRELLKKQAQLRKVNAQLRAGGKNTATWGKALGSFQFKFNALGNIAANVTSQITRQFSRAMRDAARILVDFDQAMADVQAVTGATQKEFDALSKSAKSLGGTTKFTASQVAQLQKEYAKLGFTTTQILAAQAATLDLAAATNTELPRAAEVVGVTIKQFGLNASEARRVTDVMARSFTSSALDMEKFAESMKFVGPAAKASGISVERTTAILGQLADAGISGSMAGTSLRQIMLALSKESGTFSDKIRKAAEGGLDLAGASEEVQRRAATALLVLADGTDTIDDFTESLENAGGAAQRMADIQLDTLAGQATLVKSAWEGMVLAMLHTEENLTGVKWALQGIVTLLNAMAIRAETGFTLSQSLAIEKSVQDGIERANSLMDHQLITVDELKGGLQGIGKVLKEFGQGVIGTLFPDEEIVKLENIDKEVKKLMGETLFKEEDQDGILGAMFGINQDVAKNVGDQAQSILDGVVDRNAEAIQKDVDNAKAAEEEKLQATKEGEGRKAAIRDAAFVAAGDAADAFANLIEANKQKELSAAGDNAKERERIEKEYARKQQAIAIAQTVINTAESVQKTFAQLGYPLGIPFAAAALASGLGQVAIIKNQKFAEGGWVDGEPHSRGGVNIEAEGGEFVINKRSSGKYGSLIEAINEDDQVRIMDAMTRDRKIQINGSNDPYTRKMYELLSSQERYGEDNDFYIVHKGNRTLKIRKN